MQNTNGNAFYNFWEIIPKNQVFLPNFLQIYDVENIVIKNKLFLSPHMNSNSKFIKVYLNFVMFDCLARDFSNGFFDDNDVHPAELWVDYKKEEYIIAFIPKEYENMVDLCIKDTMSESIEWL